MDQLFGLQHRRTVALPHSPLQKPLPDSCESVYSIPLSTGGNPCPVCLMLLFYSLLYIYNVSLLFLLPIETMSGNGLIIH